MQVRMAWNRRAHECIRCNETIEVGDYVIIGRSFYKSGPGKGKWSSVRRWHVDCWIADEKGYLRDNPYVPRKSTGRPPLEVNGSPLDEEAKQQRLRLLRRRASLKFRQRKAAEACDVPKVLGLEVAIQELADDIQAYGPLPKKWKIE